MSEIEFLLLWCLKQTDFFGSFDELKILNSVSRDCITKVCYKVEI